MQSSEYVVVEKCRVVLEQSKSGNALASDTFHITSNDLQRPSSEPKMKPRIQYTVGLKSFQRLPLPSCTFSK